MGLSDFFYSLVYGGIYRGEKDDEYKNIRLFTYEWTEILDIGIVYHKCVLLTDWGLYKKGDTKDEILISKKF